MRRHRSQRSSPCNVDHWPWQVRSLVARLRVHQRRPQRRSPIRSQLRGQASSTGFGAVATTGERDTVIRAGIGSESHTPSITTMDSNLRSERLSSGKGLAHRAPAAAMAPRGSERAMEEWLARSQRQRDLASRLHRSCRLRLRICECVLLIAVDCDQSGEREFVFKNADISGRTANADNSVRKRVMAGSHLLARRLSPANDNHETSR